MIGIDEVGRGAWAGPLLVVAARLKKGHKLPKGLNDSKLLTKKQRQRLFPHLLESCDVGEGWVSADMIDSLGLSRALKSACLLATFQIAEAKDDNILLDGNVNYFQGTGYTKVTVKPKADQTEAIVSAASILAKVLRDRYMEDIAGMYFAYGFESNVGYGTAYHHEALKKHGVTNLHRKSFTPIKALL